MDELLQRVLQQLGKTPEEFDQDVEEMRKQSNPEMTANLIAMMMQNAEFTAMMLSTLMMENEDLKSRVEQLEGGQPA
ncbi:hypothetical protein [Peribacillus asahii]|uniref:hypothetical protein n=1 Tax=Peribacillus asahii TaxID=228899 RepID=UPI00207AEA7A|nr:hypothetical protein [Peribacillus asahii]USK85741.1 hypothetical protein LIT35_03480 [Peribacillus asahii]